MSSADRTLGFLYDPFDPPLGRSIAHENAVNALLQRFGPPTEVDSQVATDAGDPTVTAEFITWRFDGMTIRFKGSVDQERRWITALEISGGSARLKHGLGLGVTRSEFEEKLTPALFNRDPESLRFSSSNLDTTVVDFPGAQADATLIVDFDSEAHATKLTWTYHGD